VQPTKAAQSGLVVPLRPDYIGKVVGYAVEFIAG
jgi:hypothetical protein